MRRDLGPLLLLFLVLGLLAGFAWLTRHPDAPVLRRAEGWPFIGPLATWMRERYLPPEPAPAVAEEEPLAAPGPAAVAPLVAPPAAGPVQAGPRVWILPGTVLRLSPAEAAPAILEVATMASAARLERRGDWFRVNHRGIEGWVFLEGYDETGGPPYGDAPEPPGPLEPLPPDEAKLAAARRYLGDRERASRVGPYAFYTDSRDDELVARLDRLAAQLEAVYVERYALRPRGTPRAALVLYRTELPYRLFQRRQPQISGLPSTGHSAKGVAAFFVGERSRGEVGATLVHELVHLLNRRALGPALPPWLDEGLADDLASARVDPDGTIRPQLIGGERRREGSTVRVTGGVATLLQLRDELDAGGPPLLPDLLGLDWESFVRDDRSRLHYGASAFWVRYLLQGEDGRHSEAFRRFLAAVAAGRPATAEALRQELGQGWDVLERGYRAWVLAEAARVEPRPETPAGP